MSVLSLDDSMFFISVAVIKYFEKKSNLEDEGFIWFIPLVYST